MEKELKELISLEIIARQKDARKSNSLASAATLIAALTSFMSAGYAIYLNFQTSELQNRLDTKQQILDKNDKYSNENSRIGLIYHQPEINGGCAAISLNDDVLWNSYAKCLAQATEGIDIKLAKDTDFSQFNDFKVRKTCLTNLEKNGVKIPHCRK